ncbi:hypothetical protein WJX79_002930 [Trebouxia sp. C0005]
MLSTYPDIARVHATVCLLSSKGLVNLAEGMPHMQAFCVVSTAYVNANLPKGSAVEERIYPLHDHGVPVDQTTEHMLTSAFWISEHLLAVQDVDRTHGHGASSGIIFSVHSKPSAVWGSCRPAMPWLHWEHIWSHCSYPCCCNWNCHFHRILCRVQVTIGDIVAALVLAATAATAEQSCDIHPVSVMHTSGVLGVRTEQARTCIKEGTGSDERLMLGCKTWKDLGSSSMDRNMPFLCDSAKKLSEGQLSLHHSGQCLVWNDRPEHVWDQHTSSHAAGVDNKRYLQKRKQ